MRYFILILFASLQVNAFNQAIPDYVDDLPQLIEPVAEASIDLDSIAQDFILETKQIHIPGHPQAFNPSIIRWKGSLLMSFRSYNPITWATNPICLVWLDENFEPMSEIQVFEFPFHNPVLMSKQQDPRLIAVGDHLYLIYNNIKEDVTYREMRRMFVVELFENDGVFSASEPECLTHFEGENEMRYEKNWVPFVYQDTLLLAYSLIPHRIFQPIFGTNSCVTVCSTKHPFEWSWGFPRGGTQALLDGDHYLGFFHSWIDVPTKQSDGRKITHYVMGAYTFDAKPPFAMQSVSPEPLVATNFYAPPYYKTWKPLRCVFPCGMLFDDQFIWISYGRQDNELWIAKLDKQKLMQSLVPVQ